jgi:hypothetical protein
MSDNNMDLKDQLEKEAQMLIQQQEGTPTVAAEVVTPTQEAPPAVTLGKAQRFQEVEMSEEDVLAAEIGWKNVPMSSLPSQGMFYPATTQVAIRPATVSEIRHWSTIDENDLLSLDDMLNFIMEKCCRIKVPGKPGTFKDLKEIDRFYLIFAIRDYTFKNGENRLFVTADDDGIETKIEVTKDSLDYFNPDGKLMEFYNANYTSYGLLHVERRRCCA